MRALSLDQGTTGTKTHLLEGDGGFRTLASHGHRQILPGPGLVEHDPEELIAALEAGIAAAATIGRIDAVGIANQGETVIAFDRTDGRPLANAIVWQDTRTLAAVERMQADGAEPLVRERAGLPLDPYFSASKLAWLLDTLPEARRLHGRGRLGLATSDAFFLARLTGSYATDVTTASRTSLMNLRTGRWDEELCRLFGVPIEVLPEIRPTVGRFGALVRGPLAGVPVLASVVDQQAALYGHGCRRPGDAKITFGTGAFALAVAGPEPRERPEAGILPTVAWQRAGEPATYAVDGGVYTAAAAVDWARSIGLFADYAELDGFEAAPAIDRGLVFVPALAGLGAPHWDRRAAGLWIGLGLDTTRRDMLQALLEGIALRAAEVILAFEPVVGRSPAISVDGGLTRSRYFLGILATALGRPVRLPATLELTGLGAAEMALAGLGIEVAGGAGTASGDVLPSGSEGPQWLARFGAAVERARAWRT